MARDPFRADPQPLILGSHCSSCGRVVCVSSVSLSRPGVCVCVRFSFLQTCSVFYTKRFCADCVKSNLKEFPKEIQQV